MGVRGWAQESLWARRCRRTEQSGVGRLALTTATDFFRALGDFETTILKTATRDDPRIVQTT